MSDVARCDNCNRRLDRPSFYEPCAAKHSQPDAAQELVEKIDRKVHSRKQIGWDMCDSEIIDEIRDELAYVVREEVMRVVREAIMAIPYSERDKYPLYNLAMYDLQKAILMKLGVKS